MNLLVIGFYVWVGILVLKIFNIPGVKEFTWGDLFLIPVIIFLYRVLLFLLEYVVFPVLGIIFLWWLVSMLGHLDLPSGHF